MVMMMMTTTDDDDDDNDNNDDVRMNGKKDGKPIVIRHTSMCFEMI